MEVFALSILFFLILRTIVALVNAFGGLYLQSINQPVNNQLSVLIPARNEEENLPVLLNSLLQSDYPDFEIWVCDDHSTDSTARVLKEWSEKDKRIHYFKGKDLPAGWAGKNFACHQLAQKASGDYFLFLDADVVVSEGTLSKAVRYSAKNKLCLLTIFPKQVMQTISEQISVPFMNWALLNLLPLALVSRSKNPLFAAANGQFMLFNGEGYRKNTWHEQVKESTGEDILIARFMKEAQKKVAVLLGNDDVFCRMYTDYPEALNGFSRNVHEFFLGKRWLMVFFWAVLVSGPFVVFGVLGWQPLVFFLALVVMNRFAVSGASKQKVFINIGLHPFQMLFFTQLVFKNIKLKLTKRSEWKGRIISV